MEAFPPAAASRSRCAALRARRRAPAGGPRLEQAGAAHRSAARAGGARPVPFRTRKLSRRAPRVLRGQPVGGQGAADRWTAPPSRGRIEGPFGAPLLFRGLFGAFRIPGALRGLSAFSGGAAGPSASRGAFRGFFRFQGSWAPFCFRRRRPEPRPGLIHACFLMGCWRELSCGSADR